MASSSSAMTLKTWMASRKWLHWASSVRPRSRPGDQLQIFEVEFEGTFSGLLKLTFAYDADC